tara:strand:+ start:865 stop:1179 length:315 start_codon:yes stop_codon:yes gene_type:complete
MKTYPPTICGPLLCQYRGEYDESLLDDITIDNKRYKIDIYGNVSGYESCLFSYDSCGNLEEVGIWENGGITEYTFGYTYFSQDQFTSKGVSILGTDGVKKNVGQ